MNSVCAQPSRWLIKIDKDTAMSLRDAMRKAAGLLIEIEPEASTPARSLDAVSWSENSKAVDSGAAPSIDELLAVLDDEKGKPKVTAPPASTPATNAPAKTVEQVVRDAPGPNLDQIRAGASTPSANLMTPDGKTDFAAIYKNANLPAAPFSAEQMLELIKSLPAELPLETRRQTVKVTLSALGKTMGASPETIVADASRKLAALEACVAGAQKSTQAAATKAETEIAELQKQVAQKQKEIETSRQKLLQLTQGCEAQSRELDDVLEFFSLDVPPSKYAPSTEPSKKS
jgi:hypothetical protein